MLEALHFIFESLILPMEAINGAASAAATAGNAWPVGGFILGVYRHGN